MSDDLFLKIINREIPADIVFESDAVLAFRDINPVAPVHILVIPKKHIPGCNDLKPQDEALMGKLILAAKEIAEAEGIDQSGYRLVINCGEAAGQAVFHIHLHLIGGRDFNWPPG